MTRETQSNNKGCFGYVASYITGEPFSVVADYIGHDANERGYSETEIANYLLSRGYLYGHGLSFTKWRIEDKHDKTNSSIKSFHLSESMFTISEILGMDKNAHLQKAFDTLIQDFIEEHRLDLPVECQSDVDIIDSVDGVNGRDFQNEVRRVGHVTNCVSLHQPAVVTALIRRGKHALYWDGEQLWDPHCKDPVDIGRYTILEWTPVKKIAPPSPPHQGDGANERNSHSADAIPRKRPPLCEGTSGAIPCAGD